MLQKIRKSKKGFTLVEVIVVLVILAILAAILVPSMTGWIDEANKKTSVVEARTLLLACQTIASEEYGKLKTTPAAGALTAAQESTAETMASVNATITTGSVTYDAKYTITQLICTSNGHTVTYTPTDGFVVS